MTQVPEQGATLSADTREVKEQELEVANDALSSFRRWVLIAFIAMIILSGLGKNTAEGIGLAFVTTALFLLTPEIEKALSSRDLSTSLKEGRWWPTRWRWWPKCFRWELTARRWQRGMAILGFMGCLVTALGFPFTSRLVSLIGVAVIEAAAFGFIPVWVNKAFEPLDELAREDEELRKKLKKFEERKGLVLLGALMFIAGSLLQFAATVF